MYICIYMYIYIYICIHIYYIEVYLYDFILLRLYIFIYIYVHIHNYISYICLDLWFGLTRRHNSMSSRTDSDKLRLEAPNGLEGFWGDYARRGLP